MSNLTNGRVILKFDKSTFVRKIILHYVATSLLIYTEYMN